MRILDASTVAKGLMRGLRGPRDEWGSATEALCQFYELIGSVFAGEKLSLPDDMHPASMALALGTQLDWLGLSGQKQDTFTEGLASLRDIDEAYFCFAP